MSAIADRPKKAAPGCGSVAKRGCLILVAMGIFVAALGGALWVYLHPPTERSGTLVYGERNARELTLEVFKPVGETNGAGVVFMVSGGWKSDPSAVEPWVLSPLLRSGYTVFAVAHRSQPEASVGEIIQDVSRGVRWVRHHATEYGVDPARLGATGGSAGGHLSLMMATRGGPGPAEASDPIDRESSAVQAVGIFFPVTDLLNLGDSTENDGTGGPPKSFRDAFGEGAGDLAVWRGTIGRELSPIYHVSPDMPPVLIIHGDADTLTPLDQSERFATAAREVGATVELVVKPGKEHGWFTMLWDLRRIARWFDEHL
ncbi:alpha/beta hydrolase [soil metagenome]